MLKQRRSRRVQPLSFRTVDMTALRTRASEPPVQALIELLDMAIEGWFERHTAVLPSDIGLEYVRAAIYGFAEQGLLAFDIGEYGDGRFRGSCAMPCNTMTRASPNSSTRCWRARAGASYRPTDPQT
jgi:hypothetical protein